MIGLERLKLRCRIGVSEAERREFRTIEVDLRLHTDLSRAAESDALRDTIDYSAVAQALVASVEDREFRLIERLAGHLLETLLAQFPITRAWIRVRKPDVASSGAAFCELERR